MGDSGERPAGIKDIAKALGVSIGTVDRALHERAGINPMTRARVLKMAQTLGYRPNVAARHLKLKRKLVISAHLPEQIASFFDALREGIEEAADPFRATIEVQFRSYPRLGEGDAALLEQTLQQRVNGVIVAPGHPTELKPFIRKAARSDVPVVCVATDAPGTERLTAISSDPTVSGALVAELLTRFVARKAPALVVTGNLSTVDHAEKLRGFRQSLASLSSPLQLIAVAEAHDDPGEAYRLTKECLQAHPTLAAVYVSTANSITVLQALRDAGRANHVAAITTDLFPALVPLIRSGEVLATVYQRPKAQGRMAFQALYQFLVEGVCPPARHRLPPHIILRSNLDLFLEMLPGDLEQAVGSAHPQPKRTRTRKSHP
jgi:LacI family transcriptional regulator